MVVIPTDTLGHDVEGALHDASSCQELLGLHLQVTRIAPQSDDLHAVVVVEVDVQRAHDAISEIVLQVGELLRQVTHMMVVHEDERPDRGHARLRFGSRHLRPNESADDLGTICPALPSDLVEIVEQRLLHRDAETYQVEMGTNGQTNTGAKIGGTLLKHRATQRESATRRFDGGETQGRDRRASSGGFYVPGAT